MKCRLCPRESGHLKTCATCRRKRNALTASWRRRNRRKFNRLNRHERQRRLDEGVCIYCRDRSRPLISAWGCGPCVAEKAAESAARLGLKLNSVCGACGAKGHIRSNRHCPKRFAVDSMEFASARNEAC